MKLTDKIRATFIAAAILTVFLSSCDKPKKLEAERVKLVAERAQALAEIEAINKKLDALGKRGVRWDDIETTERNAFSLLSQATTEEARALEKLQKWTDLEARLAALRTKIDAYKTSHIK